MPDDFAQKNLRHYFGKSYYKSAGTSGRDAGVLLKGEKNAESKWNFNARIFTSVQIRDRMFLEGSV